MEDHRFDDVARSLSSGTTRRSVLRLLAAGAAGGLSAVTGAGAKAAPGGGKGKPAKPPCCPAGYDALCTIDGRPTCIDTRTDAANCGACGTICPSGVCTNGVCSPTVCTPGSIGESCTAGIGACERTGVLLCTADGSAYECDAVPGEPQQEMCNGIDDDCDGFIDEDFNFLADVNHCGGCNQECQIPNATPACVNGSCGIANCHVGYADCDGRVDNGCETNTTNDVGSCGSCGEVCDAPQENGTVACVNSTCVVTCDQGYHLAGTTNQPECVADAGCNVNNGGCHPVATCTDTVGGAVCQCPAGYSGNGVGEAGCVDIDECLTNNPCSPNASCTNTEGSFECTCNDGYTGNGLTCEPVVPGLVSVSVDPNPLLLGATGTGTVTLDAPVMENTTITLASSNAAELMVDGTTAVPAGQMSGTFAVQRLAGDDGSFATVSATLGDQTVTTEVGFTP